MRTLVVDANQKLSVREVSMPKYTECQALVKTLACGICNGTDMKIIHGKFKNFDTYPATLGHEGVGKVVEVGSKVKNLKVGDVVMLPYVMGKIDDVYAGWGGYSEYCVVGDLGACIENGMGPGTPDFSEVYYAQTVIKPEDKVDPVEAIMIVTFREVLSAIKRFNIKPNENVFVMGAGPVGLCFTKFCKLLGATTVITSDIDDAKVTLAKQMGADYAFNSKKTDVSAEVKKLFPQGVDHAIDAVGVLDLINEAMALIKYNGQICCYGISPELCMNLDWSKAPYNWVLHFNQMPLKIEEMEAHAQVMSWINFGILKPNDFISDVFAFDKILDAFELVEAKKSGTSKVVIKYY